MKGSESSKPLKRMSGTDERKGKATGPTEMDSEASEEGKWLFQL